MAKKKQPESSTAIAELPCTFGGASVGKKTRRIGVSVARSHLTTAQADKFLCGKQIGGTIVARANGGSDQQSLPGADQDAVLTGTFEVKGYGVTPDAFSFGLTFVKSTLPDGALDPFANKAGAICIEDVSAIPEGSGSDDEGDGEGE